MSKEYCTAIVQENKKLASGIYSMIISCPLIASSALPGQFLNIYCKDNSRLLPRPISICETDESTGSVRIVYRISGAGTAEFSDYSTGDKMNIMGPLGNGFPLDHLDNKKIILIGGGIGIPPMLNVAKTIYSDSDYRLHIEYKNSSFDNLQSKTELIMINGYRDNDLFLDEDFRKYGTVYVATEDGSVGIKGNVLDVINSLGLTADIIFACGPMPMLRAVKAYADDKGISAYISLEEKMACGIGACLACVCKSKEKDEHTNVMNKRICKEGPVFKTDCIEI